MQVGPAITQTLTVPLLQAVSIAFLTTAANITPPLAGTPYTMALQAVDSSAAPAAPTFSILDGELPAGLELDAAGVIHGTSTDVVARAVTFAVTSTVGHVTAELFVPAFAVMPAA